NAADATVNGPVSGDNPISTPAVSFTYYPGSDTSGTALPGAPKNAGTYTVQASFGGNGNYNAKSATKTITIDKASSTTKVTCPSSPLTYDGTARTPCSVSVTGAGGLSLSPDPNYSNNTNAGTATASYTYGGDD